MTDASLLFTPTRRARSFELVVEQIREAVLDGKLATGERLPNERELCAMFGISRSTLREGLRALEALGVIDVRAGAGGGVFASEPQSDHAIGALELLMQFSDATTRDLAEFRITFEAETAFSAAQRAKPDDLAALDDIVCKVAKLAVDATLPWPMLAEMDLKFHEAVAKASHNQVRTAIMLGISRALLRASKSLDPVMGPSERLSIARDLKGIAAAVGGGKGSLARTRMRRHVKRFSELQLLVDEGRAGELAKKRGRDA